MTAKNAIKKIRTFVTEHENAIAIGGSAIVSGIACCMYICGRIGGFDKGFDAGFEMCNRIVIAADPEGYPILREKAKDVVDNKKTFLKQTSQLKRVYEI